MSRSVGGWFRALRTWWLNRRARTAARKNASTPLREFVYVDDVSVYSLLASRIGAVADSITESQASSLSLELAGGGTLGDSSTASASASSKVGYSRSNTSQVLRKATIQSTFRQFYELERARIIGVGLGKSDQTPQVTNEQEWASLLEGGHLRNVIPTSQLERGRLIELRVELDTERLFQFVAIVSAVTGVIKHSSSYFPTAAESLRRVEDGVDLLQTLLVGLIPIVGTASDYVVARSGPHSALVERRVIRALPSTITPLVEELRLVGVAEEHLFWRDIRRVLFSRGQYRVLARVGRSGLHTEWNPIKLMDLLGRIDPSLPNLLKDLALPIPSAVHQAAGAENHKRQAVLTEFSRLVCEKNRWQIEGGLTSEVVAEIAETSDLDDFDSRREAFDRVVVELERLAGGFVDRQDIPELRDRAMASAEEHHPIPQGHNLTEGGQLIDSEIVGIYW